MMLTLAEKEVQLEGQRNKLCVSNLFEPYGAFSRIDRAGKGFVTARDVCNYLDNLGFYLMESQCAFVVTYFDSDPVAHSNGHRLCYAE